MYLPHMRLWRYQVFFQHQIATTLTHEWFWFWALFWQLRFLGAFGTNCQSKYPKPSWDWFRYQWRREVWQCRYIIYRLIVGIWQDEWLWNNKLKFYLSKQTIRHPVTLGSKVPEWPVFSTLRILLIQATTSWELGLDGLSRLMHPYFKYSFKGLLSGVEPAGIGV